MNQIQKCFDEVRLRKAPLFSEWSKADLNLLASNLKVLQFNQEEILASKDQPVDFFGIILKGRIAYQCDFKTYQYLEIGDMCGYMSFYNLSGTQLNQFDLIAEEEGFIALIREVDLIQLRKKEPYTAFKIYELMGRKTLEVVNYQFFGESPNNEVVHTNMKNVSLKSKREQVENCPPLAQFLHTLDKRDVKYFLSATQMIEIVQGDLIVRTNTKAKFIFVILQGSVQSFKALEESQKYYPGSIIGLKEYLYGLNWQQNFYGSEAGVFLKLNKEHFEDIIDISPQSSINILSRLVQFQCQDMHKEMLKIQNQKAKQDEIRTIYSQRMTNSSKQGQNKQPTGLLSTLGSAQIQSSSKQMQAAAQPGKSNPSMTHKSIQENIKGSSISMSGTMRQKSPGNKERSASVAERALEYIEFDISKSISDATNQPQSQQLIGVNVGLNSMQMKNLKNQKIKTKDDILKKEFLERFKPDYVIQPLCLLDIHRKQNQKTTQSQFSHQLGNDEKQLQDQDHMDIFQNTQKKKKKDLKKCTAEISVITNQDSTVGLLSVETRSPEQIKYRRMQELQMQPEKITIKEMSGLASNIVTERYNGAFLKDKLLGQQMTNQHKSNDLRRLKQELKPVAKKQQDTNKLSPTKKAQEKLNFKQMSAEQQEEEYEDLQISFKLAMDRHQKGQYKLEKLNEDNERLKIRIQELNNENMCIQAKVNMNQVQKELLANAASQIKINVLQDSQQSMQVNFKDVLNHQILINKQYKLVSKCASKWLFITRRNKKLKQLNQK